MNTLLHISRNVKFPTKYIRFCLQSDIILFTFKAQNPLPHDMFCNCLMAMTTPLSLPLALYWSVSSPYKGHGC